MGRINRKQMSIGTLFNITFVLTTALIVGFVVLGSFLFMTEKSLTKSQAMRYDSYILADELRQNSDDLTRMARTYVITGEGKYDDYYNRILGIRNGILPRPENYDRIYWDLLIASGLKPTRDSDVTKSLRELMVDAGITQNELEKLSASQNNADEMIHLELIAMDAVKGVFSDEARAMMLPGESNRDFAIRILHDDNYHTVKASVLAPVNEFLQLLDARTASRVKMYSDRLNGLLYTVAIYLIVILLGIITLFIKEFRRIQRPLKEMPIVIENVSEGDLNQELLVSSNDEFGRIAVSFNNMVGNVKEIIVSILDISSLLNKTAVEVTDNTEKVHASSDEVSRAIEEIAEGTGNLAAMAMMTLESSQKLAHSIDSISDMMHRINVNTNRMKEKNDFGIKSMENLEMRFKENTSAGFKVEKRIKQLAEKSKLIGSIIGSIESIAEQTNLLSLNAAIEAARAGEAGKGFAVVADEVRKLAEESAESTNKIQRIIKEITQVINDTEQEMTTASKIIEEANASLAETTSAYKDIIQSTNKTIEDINEVNANLETLNDVKQTTSEAMTEMSSVTEETAASVEEITASIEEQAAIITSISKMMHDLSKMVDILGEKSHLFKVK